MPLSLSLALLCQCCQHVCVSIAVSCEILLQILIQYSLFRTLETDWKSGWSGLKLCWAWRCLNYGSYCWTILSSFLSYISVNKFNSYVINLFREFCSFWLLMDRFSFIALIKSDNCALFENYLIVVIFVSSLILTNEFNPSLCCLERLELTFWKLDTIITNLLSWANFSSSSATQGFGDLAYEYWNGHFIIASRINFLEFLEWHLLTCVCTDIPSGFSIDYCCRLVRSWFTHANISSWCRTLKIPSVKSILAFPKIGHQFFA